MEKIKVEQKRGYRGDMVGEGIEGMQGEIGRRERE